MQLKKIEMHGFKSFADRIELDFESGITTFIGPNGSGKSNISDAIRWVLGEHNPRLLRSPKMDDVIFVGSETRRPVGYAEVSITFDNSDGVLPIDYNEVTVTRKVYKSGESEFEINKSACRLKDIRELFMDTGIGREGYSIIGQGRIESILNAKAEDRRAIFEEATGIIKFRTRKEEAEKKLEAAQQNLESIRIILNELEKQQKILSRDSAKAKEYVIVRDELQSLEVGMYIGDIRNMSDKLGLLSVKKKEIEKSVEDAEILRQEYDEKKRALGEKEQDFMRKLDEAKDRLHRHEIETETLKGEQKLKMRRREELTGDIAEAQYDIQQSSENKAKYEKEIKRLEEEKILRESEVSSFRKKIADEKLKLTDNTSRINEIQEKNIILKNDIQALTENINANENRRAAVKSACESIQNRINSLHNEILQIEVSEKSTIARTSEQQKQIDAIKAELENRSRLIAEIIDERNSVIEDEAQTKKEKEALTHEFEVKNARYRSLKEMEDTMEGYQRGVKELMLARSGNLAYKYGLLGTVSDIFEVTEKYEVAIEYALGGSVQNIVTEKADDARKAVEYLRQNKLGRVTFLPVETIRGRKFDSSTLDSLSGEIGFIGEASSLVSTEPKYKEIAASLLGKTAIVDDLNSAIKISNKYDKQFKIITLEGDVINVGGAISGGSRDNLGRNFLSRKREITMLDKDIGSIKGQIGEKTAKLENIKTIFADIDSELNERTASYRELELDTVKQENILNALREGAERDVARKDMLLTEEKEHKAEVEAYISEDNEIENRLTVMKERVSILMSESDKIQTENANILEAREKINIYVGELNGEAAKAEITVANITQNIMRENLELKSYMERCDKAGESIERYGQAIKEIDGELVVISETLEKCEKKHALYESEISATTERRSGISSELDNLFIMSDENEKAYILLINSLGNIRTEIAKVNSETETVKNRLWDQYSLTFEMSEGVYPVPENITETKARVEVLREKIRKLGNVNVTAIEQYAENMERYRMIKVQEEDVAAADEKLRKIISEITTRMKRQFLEQFEKINESFNHVFVELFGGGKAYVELSDEINVLDSGIEIVVQLPGKKLQNISLMSGGEKALTAIALLFGILRLKPSPFCLLDEIEAALDEANVNRFSNYLKTCAKTTQFLVITHRRGTMEISTSIYGVTMEEPGVSKIVSMKMKE